MSWSSQKKAFDGINIDYLRKRHEDPSEWLGKTTSGKYVYVVATSAHILHTTGKDVASALQNVLNKDYGKVPNASVHGKAVPSDEMCDMLGINKLCIVERGDK
jgi:hypothetical protein